MKKTTALIYLGPGPVRVAQRLGISRQAVYQWPPVLPKATADAVLAELTRTRARERIAQGQLRPDDDPLLADLLTV